MDRRDKTQSIKDHLRQMAESMEELAHKLSDHPNAEILNSREKKLIQLAYLPHIDECMRELKMFYLMDNKEDIESSLSYIHDLMVEAI